MEYKSLIYVNYVKAIKAHLSYFLPKDNEF